jgi:hypothetical protein
MALDPQLVDADIVRDGDFSRPPPAPRVTRLGALAFVLIIGKGERFQCGKQIELSGTSAIGGVERDRRRLGDITKQGNSLLRLQVEVVRVTVRNDRE